ncbi:DUF3311 domain-containing protein [Anaerospora hongkongensis]|uniref:DUF3311 domain-containing protein n=1 Tax=Anaerospora hongkongensis TaxID=244830 RepID=UPI00289BB180|nr:DUF3311 domain-containing protein [Anaerospora hongkongensis]
MNAVRVLLTLIPFIWSIGLLPFANRVKPLVMGLPFLAFWLVAGIIIAFLCIKALYTLDSKNNGAKDA